MFDQHPHRPLSTSRSIRLLECKRRGRKSNGLEDLELRLVEASLDNLPPYFALSYVWGDTKATESIVCDGKKLWITRNCASALGRILPSTSTCTIWVDSICIDQSCIPERNAQVALMSEIFSCAEKVLVWLGEGDKDSRKAISYLKRLATIVELPSRRMMEFGLNATLEAMEGASLLFLNVT